PGMRIVMTLCFVSVASAASAGAPEAKPETVRADEKDLSGAWDGDAGRARDWGEINLKVTADGYIGTYSDTFNRQLGSITFRKIGERMYKGLWWESNLKRYGTCELEVSKDGGTVTMTWKALDDRKGAKKDGKSTWKRKG